ncbi:MAG TPA: CPBP family intramembrane glutamic endopeptidase, partial [Gaiellales bacterium]|nr:CPBP family intramembrane glutamic endopeptidase [Gaiellales bacterium]
MTHPISTDEPPGSAWLRTVGAAALLMVCYLALSTAAFYVSAVGGSVTLAGGVAAVVVGGVLGVVAVRMAMALDATPPRLRAVMSGTNRSRRAIVPLLVAAIVIVAVVPMLVVVAERLGARGTTALPLRREPAGWDLALAFVAIALAPWMEEISVRGLLFTGLQRRFGFWPAAAASGFVWAALHRAPAVLVAFTVAGVALAWVRRRTGSVRAGV